MMSCLMALASCSGSSSHQMTKEELLRLAATDDYETMLDQLALFTDECAALRDDYIHSRITERQAKESMRDALERYAPVIMAMKEAGRNGDLTYDQQQQMADFHLGQFDMMLGIAGDTAADALDQLINEGAEQALKLLLDN